MRAIGTKDLASIKKNRTNLLLYLLAITVVVGLFILILLVQGGKFAKVPKVEAVADNCYPDTIHVITDDDYRPFSFYDEEGKFSGFDVELITLVANKLHMTLDLKLMRWDEGIAATLDGKAQVLMTCDNSDSFEGVDQLIKTKPTSFDEFIVYSNTNIHTVSALYGKKIGIMKNGNVTPLMHMLGLDSFCVKFKDNRSAMQAVMDGKVDYAIMRQSVGATLLKELKATETEPYFSAGQSYLCYGVNKDNKALVEKINRAVDELRASGEYYQLRKKWLTTFMRDYTFTEVVRNNVWITVAFFLLLIFIITMFFINRERDARLRIEHKREQSKRERLIESFTKAYDLAFLVKISEDEFKLLRYRPEFAGYGLQFNNFTEAKSFFINEVLHPADKERMRKELDYDTIRQKLVEQRSYDVEYRALRDMVTIWSKMTISYIEEDVVAVGFAVKDLEIVKELVEADRMDEYIAMYAVDIDTGMMKPFKTSDKYKTMEVGQAAPYTEKVKAFAETLQGEGRDFFMKMSNMDFVKKELAHDNKRTFSYKSSVLTGERWIELVSYVINRHEDGSPSMFTMGFSNADAFASSRNEMKHKLEEQQQELLQAYDNLQAANLRNELLYDIANAAKWAYSISKDGEIVAAQYSDIVKDNYVVDPDDNPMAWTELLHPEDKERVTAEFLAAARDRNGKTPYETTYRLVDENGKFNWVKASGRVIRHADGTGEMLGVSINITNQIDKEREQQQMLADALSMAQVASKSKTSFLFNMSHDIRTPMNAITGFTSMAKRNMGDKDRLTSYLDKIDVAGQQLLLLINQVLEMSRIESGKIELEEKPMNLRDKYEGLVTVLAEQAKVKGLRFHHSLSDIEHYHILADETRMGQITLNIVGNAIKYTPEGGKIDYKLKEIPSRKEGYATYVFTVKDTGIGMSKEFLDILFEPFTREKSSTVSKIQGTGLGMSIVKSLVDLLGGTIEVESELGKGTRFDITLDLKIDEEKSTTSKKMSVTESVADETALAGIKDKHVLLVEDNELNREIARYLLEDLGLKVDEAEDGSIAVEKMKHAQPGDYDLILMDIQMPVMDGYEATRAIRELEKRSTPTLLQKEGVKVSPLRGDAEGSLIGSSHIPIIALSANAFEEDRQKSHEAGMDAHIAKPIDIEELKKVLLTYL